MANGDCSRRYFPSIQQSKKLVDWLVESGKNLTAIYIARAHGDYFFGLKLVLDRFPEREGACHSCLGCCDAKPNQAGACAVVLGDPLSWSGSAWTLRRKYLGSCEPLREDAGITSESCESRTDLYGQPQKH